MIRILTDSASDLTATDSARPGVYTVPLSVTLADGTGGLDGVELTADEFYAHLKVDKVPPRTSQPSPQSFMTIFEDAKENGDQVIAILISSNLSGTYQCARLAAESCDFEDVFFVDSARHPRARPSWFAKRCACATRSTCPRTRLSLSWNSSSSASAFWP